MYPGVRHEQLPPQQTDITPRAVSGDSFLWTSYRGDLQIDSTILEPFYLGRKKSSDEETAVQWRLQTQRRLELFDAARPTTTTDGTKLGDGGKFQAELNEAISIVQFTSHLSRSLQHKFFAGTEAVSKGDRSPVTIADFAVQALILERLGHSFPADRFIAEEDSKLLVENANIRESVISILETATGETWSAERLYAAVDRGGYRGSDMTGRVWVLDPIDGTKGFMRGEHYCIALAMLVDAVPTLSVLGCPNLALERVLQTDVGSGNGDQISVSSIDKKIVTRSNDQDLTVFSPHSGSIYFAVSGKSFPILDVPQLTFSLLWLSPRAGLCCNGWFI
jgi:3'-phosphoadenosine 5'-phosphosulfate (PAPS) 3'-phosphatase